MRRSIKVLLTLVAAAAVLTAAAAIAVRVFLPPENVRTLIDNRLESLLGREVTLGDVSVGLFSGVTIADFRLSEPPSFSSGTFLTADRFVVDFHLWPLLRKRFVVDEVRLDRPAVRIVRVAGPGSNDAPPAADRSAAPSPDEESPFSLLVTRAEIVGGSVTYVDAARGLSVTAEPVNLRADNFSLTAPVDLEGNATIRAGEVSVDIELKARAGWDRMIRLEEAVASLNDGRVAVTGSLDLRPSTPVISASAVLDGFDPSGLAPVVTWPTELTWNGPVAGTASIAGPLDHLDFRASLDGSGAEWSYQGRLRKPAQTPFSLEAEGTATDERLELRRVTATLGPAAVAVTGSIGRDAGATMNLEFETAPLPFPEVLSVVLVSLPADLSLSGALRVSGAVTGTPTAAEFSVAASATDARVRYGAVFEKAAGVPLTLDVACRKTPDAVGVRGIAVKVEKIIGKGQGRLTLGEAIGYEFNFSAPGVPLSSVARLSPPVAAYRPDGHADAAVDVSSRNPLRARAVLNDASATVGQNELTNLNGRIAYGPDEIRVDGLSGRLNGGALHASATISDPAAAPAVRFDLELESLDIAKALSAFPQKAALPRRDFGLIATAHAAAPTSAPIDLTGSVKVGRLAYLNYAGTELAIALDLKDLTPDLSRLGGTASLKQGPGRVEDVEALIAKSGLARALLAPLVVLRTLSGAVFPTVSLPDFRTLNVNSIDGDYRFEKGTLALRSFNLKATDLSASSTGRIRLAGDPTTDLAVTLTFPPGVIRGTIGELLSGDDGQTVVPLTVTGPLAAPQVRVDTAKAGRSAIKALSEGAGGILEKMGIPTRSEKKSSETDGPEEKKGGNGAEEQVEEFLKDIFR